MSSTTKSATVSAGTPKQNPLLGTNIYLQILLLVTSFAGGMSETTAGMIVAAVTGGIGAVGAIRTWVVNAKWTPAKSWIKDPNNFGYISAILGAIGAGLPALVPPVRELVTALFEKNWPQVITALLSLGSILWYTFVKKGA